MVSRAAKATIISIAILACYFLVPTVLAQGDPPPDTIRIDSSAVASGLSAEGDYLFLAQYEVSWALEANYPDDSIEGKIIIQLLDTSGNPVYASSSPYVYYNNGYDKGVVSIYFTPLAAIYYNIEWEEQYKLRIITLLGEFTSTKSYTYSIPSNEYCNNGPSSQTANRNWVAEYCLNTAKTLEINWGVSSALTTHSITEVLSEYGEAYYSRVIPGLEKLCPQLFLVTNNVPEFTETVYSGSHASELQHQWDGQDNIITDGIDGAGNLIGGNSVFAMNFISLAVITALIIISGFLFRSILPGLLVGTGILIPIFVDLGFLEVALLGVIMFLYVMYAVNKTLHIGQA